MFNFNKSEELRYANSLCKISNLIKEAEILVTKFAEYQKGVSTNSAYTKDIILEKMRAVKSARGKMLESSKKLASALQKEKTAKFIEDAIEGFSDKLSMNISKTPELLASECKPEVEKEMTNSISNIVAGDTASMVFARTASIPLGKRFMSSEQALKKFLGKKKKNM